MLYKRIVEPRLEVRCSHSLSSRQSTTARGADGLTTWPDLCLPSEQLCPVGDPLTTLPFDEAVPDLSGVASQTCEQSSRLKSNVFNHNCLDKSVFR